MLRAALRTITQCELEKAGMRDDLICIGLTTLDVVGLPVDTFPGDGLALVEEATIAPAGTAAGTAYIAATLGVRAAVASQVGTDPAGRAVQVLLQERGVDPRLLATHPSIPTSTTIILVRSSGERSRFHALGASTVMTISDEIKEAVRRAPFVHYAAVGATHMDGGPGRDLLAIARNSGATITCDLISPRPGAGEELGRLLPYVDYFMPNASEALALSGTTSLEDASQRFMAMGARSCILKDGANGSLFVTPSSTKRVAAHAISPRDTTSCGDSYCAGFIAARLRGADEEGACRLATAVAALVAQGPGTLGKLEGYNQAEIYARSAPLHRP